MGMNTKKRPTQKAFLICGDEHLVVEYATLLSKSDADVFVWHDRRPSLPAAQNVWYRRALSRIPKRVIAAFELTNTARESKIERLRKIEYHCAKETIIITSTVTATATELSKYISSPQKLVGIAALPTLTHSGLTELCRSPFTHLDVLKTVSEIYFDFKHEVSVVDDRVGMVMPRILCSLINEATFALQEEVASMADIDTAMKLGTNYPHGPVEWGRKIGFDQVLAVMDALHHDTGDDRYRPSSLLRKLAAASIIENQLPR